MNHLSFGHLSDEIHVWSISLLDSRTSIRSLQTVLSPDEQERALRFRQRLDIVRYITAHGALREILSRYIGEAPQRLRFDQNENGKPYLTVEDGTPSPIQFSLSHSHDQALVAIATGHSVGVDIERMDTDPGVLAVAGRVFSANEQEAIRACSVSERLSLFFQIWVCKEAYIKARGETILDRLASFTVSISSPNQACLVSDGRDPDAASRWRIHLIQCATGFAAAAASTNIQASLVTRRWPQPR